MEFWFILFYFILFYFRRPHICKKIQELSYRKWIARLLRTQYVEGIYRPKYYTVTLKCRLKVTEGHWK